MQIDKYTRVGDILPPTEILAQMAEEASELAQAALKLRRAISGKNPTPKSIAECRKALLEEYADVLTCVRVFDEYEEDFFRGAEDVSDEKYERWIKRLEGRDV